MYRLERLEEMLHRSLQDDETRRALLDSARNEAACIDEAGLAETALDSAIVAIGLRDYDRGLMLLRKARASAHGDSARVSDTYVYEGVALGLSGNHEEALIALDSSVSYRHESPDAWARCLIEKGNRGIIYVASH